MAEQEPFDMWGIIELMGRAKIAGRVTEETHAGVSMLRVDVPGNKDNPAFTRFFGGSAIYSITPCAESIAREAASAIHTRPITIFGIGNTPQQLSAGFVQDYLQDPVFDDEAGFIQDWPEEAEEDEE